MTVVTVWESYADALLRTSGLGNSAYAAGPDGSEDAVERVGRSCAEGGAARARAAGLVSTARSERQRDSIAGTLLAVAEEIGAELVVVGTRGQGAMRSMLMGSVSHDLPQHADRPVMLAPGLELAALRRERIGAREVPA